MSMLLFTLKQIFCIHNPVIIKDNSGTNMNSFYSYISHHVNDDKF